MRAYKRPVGFTLVEVLVVVGVLFLILALLLPAVQQARASARLLGCQANLRQIGVALHQYVEVHNMLPGFIQLRRSAPVVTEWQDSLTSLHCQLLPYLDQEQLYESLNLGQTSVAVDYIADPRDWAMHLTAVQTRVATFVCPADGGARRWPGANNYRGNWGVGPASHQTTHYHDSANGFFSTSNLNSVYPVRPQHIYDGMGRTAMFTERLVGSGGDRFDRRRDARPSVAKPHDAEQTRRLCGVLTENDDAGVYSNPGKYWLFSGLHHTLYTHALPPNSPTADCLWFAMAPPWGAATARADHAGIVNVCFGDGSVRGVSDAIDLAVWRALGTRSGGEVVLESSY